LNEVSDRELFPADESVYAGGVAGKSYSEEELAAYRMVVASAQAARSRYAPNPDRPSENQDDPMLFDAAPVGAIQLAKQRGWQCDDLGPKHPTLRDIELPMGRYKQYPHGERVVVKLVLRRGDQVALRRQVKPMTLAVPIVHAGRNQLLTQRVVNANHTRLQLPSAPLTAFSPLVKASSPVEDAAVDRAARGLCYTSFGTMLDGEQKLRVLSISRPATAETTMHSWPVVYLVEVTVENLPCENDGVKVVSLDEPGSYRHMLSPLDRFMLSSGRVAV